MRLHYSAIGFFAGCLATLLLALVFLEIRVPYAAWLGLFIVVVPPALGFVSGLIVDWRKLP